MGRCIVGSVMMSILCRGEATVADDTDFLANWMGRILPAIEDVTLLDLSLPGSHDTMTYDLDTVIADGGIDGGDAYASILNEFGDLGIFGDFIRGQATAQALTVTEQLDNGIRFLDFRVMYTGGHWRSLHMVQSKGLAINYLKMVREWVDAHPNEIVVIRFTKHGSNTKTGDDQYPGVSTKKKREFWEDVEDVFHDLLVDSSSPVNTTTIKSLLAKKQRVAIYAADYAEFTGNSPRAMDAKSVQRASVSDIGDEVASIQKEFDTMQKVSDYMQTLKAENKFYLMSFANIPPTEMITQAAQISFSPIVDIMDARKACAKTLKNMPDFTDDPWCPETLLDVGQLTNYYKQITLDAALENGWGFPNGVYFDAFDIGGTIRVGTKPVSYSDTKPTCVVFKYTDCADDRPKSCPSGYTPGGGYRHWNSYDTNGHGHGYCILTGQNHYQCCRVESTTTDTARFAFVDTLILYNLKQSCKKSGAAQECSSLIDLVEERRKLFPVIRWDDYLTGRHSSWPPIPPVLRPDVVKKTGSGTTVIECPSGKVLTSCSMKMHKTKAEPYWSVYPKSVDSCSCYDDGYDDGEDDCFASCVDTSAQTDVRIVSATSKDRFTTSCPSGYKVTGCGIRQNRIKKSKEKYSYVYPSSDSSCECYNYKQDVDCYATCSKNIDNHKIVHKSGKGTWDVTCPGGRSALGCGFKIEDPGSDNAEKYPQFWPLDYYTCRCYNYYGMTCYAICGDMKSRTSSLANANATIVTTDMLI